MKREALTHPKMLDLAARMNCSRAEAIGYVTLLIDWTADYAIRGDVGKWPDGAIARGCEWHGEPGQFISALVESKWLDEHPEHRLILHDWPDHAERWVRAKVIKSGLDFLPHYGGFSTVEPTVVATVEPTTVATTVATPPRDRTEPNRTEPNLINTGRPVGAVGQSACEVGGERDYTDIQVNEALWVECCPVMNRIRDVVDPGRKLAPKDRRLCIIAAVLARERLGDSWLNDLLASYQRKSEPPAKRWAWMRKAMIDSCGRSGWDFHRLENAVQLPTKYEQPVGSFAASEVT